MDKKLFDLISAACPRFNDSIANGLAVEHMRYAEPYIDRIMRTAERDFPPELRYIGYRRCTPHEEFIEATKRLNHQSTFELARSDLYMVKYLFSFNGEELEPVYLYLPFVTEAGIITLRGSTFAISPVLADKAISVTTDSIFIPLNRDKLTFQRLLHQYYRNGERETAYVVWSQIYHLSAKDKKAASTSPIRGRTTLVHYLLAKYGLEGMFTRFANVDVKVGTSTTITSERFPPDEWVICSSSQIKPKTVRDKFYVASNLRLAIPKKDFNLTVSGMVAGFFYIVDMFPQRIRPEYVNEERLWRVLMGQLLWGVGSNEGKLNDEVVKHLRSLDSYLDSEAKTYLREDEVYCEDLYGLLYEILSTFNHRVTQSTSQVSSMFGKRLMVLRYVLKDLTSAINRFMFKVNSTEKKPLTKSDILKQMKRLLKPNLVMGINREHGEVSSVAAPGDNKYFKATSQIVLQADSSGGRGKSKTTSGDPSKHLHSSIAEVGSYSTMGKSEPTGRSKINPYVNVAPDGMIVRDPDKIPLLDEVQRIIQR